MARAAQIQVVRCTSASDVMHARRVRISRHAVLVTLLGAASLVTPVMGQGIHVDLLPPLGTEVRAILRSGVGTERSRGALVQGGEGGLVLEADQGRRVHRIPPQIVLGLEVSRGTDRTRGGVRGLLIGAGTGALLLGAIGALAASSSGECQVCGPGPGFALGAYYGAPLGAAAGTMVGLLIGSERWERVW